MNREQELLADIDEARVVLTTYRRLLTLVVVAEVGCTTLVALGIYGYLKPGAVFLAVVGMIVSFVFIWWWAWWSHSAPAKNSNKSRVMIAGPASRLRASERAYRDHLMGPSDGGA